LRIRGNQVAATLITVGERRRFITRKLQGDAQGGQMRDRLPTSANRVQTQTWMSQIDLSRQLAALEPR
jgi:hypothetical protein